MKKYGMLTAFSALLAASPLCAQNTMSVVTFSGTELAVEDLDEVFMIGFSNDQSEMYIYSLSDFGDVTLQLSEPVDIFFNLASSSSPLHKAKQKMTYTVTGGQLQVACEDGVKNIEVYDLGGKLLYACSADIISVSRLPKGVSIVKVTANSGYTETRKMMID